MQFETRTKEDSPNWTGHLLILKLPAVAAPGYKTLTINGFTLSMEYMNNFKGLQNQVTSKLDQIIIKLCYEIESK